MDTEELEALDPLHFSPVDVDEVDVDEVVLSPPFPVIHDQLLCLADVEGEVVVLDIQITNKPKWPPTRSHRKAKKIIKDINNLSHCLFTPLSSRRRGQYRLEVDRLIGMTD